MDAVFQTDDVPAADRFAYWNDCMAKTAVPVDITSDCAGAFRAEIRLFRLGATHVWATTTQPVRLERTPRLIRRFDPESYHLSLSLHGSVRITQGGRQAVLGAHDLHLLDTSRPFGFQVLPGSRPHQGVGLEIPKALVPVPPERVSRLLARRLPGRDGLGALLAGFLIRLTGETASFRRADGPRLQMVLIDLLSATLAHHGDAEGCLPPETRGRTLVRRVRAYIQQHLHDPRLTPPAVAAAHHVSVGYLHRLFSAEGSTVAAWIRHQRLEHARRDLTDPALDAQPIHAIAARWGFTHPAAFSRAFRAAYGDSPLNYRHQARPAAGEVHAPSIDW